MFESALPIYEDDHFRIEQCSDCPIPGYLILTPLSGAAHLEDLGEEERICLGKMLSSAVSAVRRVVRPVRVYCAQFGESDGPLHFHIFPRTEEITARFLHENPSEGGLIDGPRLLAWSRRTFKFLQDDCEMNRIIDELRIAMKQTTKAVTIWSRS
jgi:diadenosine tetraphosphate (Ap4A) HIT family hydrolase